MKTEIKIMREAIKEKNNRLFLTTLGLLKKEDIEFFDEQTGLNIIHHCVKENACKELKLIIAHIPNIDLMLKSQGIVQKSALEMASSINNKEISHILIEAGALFDMKKVKKTFNNDYKLIELMNEIKVQQAYQKSLEPKEEYVQPKKKKFFSFLF